MSSRSRQEHFGVDPKRLTAGGRGEWNPLAGNDTELGDEDGEIAPGTLFEQLPAEWVCPECAETKDQFVKA